MPGSLLSDSGFNVKDPACFRLCARGLNFSKYKQAGYRVRVLCFQSKRPGMNFSARADTTFNLKDPARTSSLSAHSCRVLNFGTRRSNLRTRHVFTFSVQWPFPTFSPFFPFLFPFPSFPSPFLSLFLIFPPFLPLSPFFLSHFFLPLLSVSLAITLLQFTSSHHSQSAPDNFNTLSQHSSFLSQP